MNAVTGSIHVNQVGYGLQDRKTFFTTDVQGAFEIVDIRTNQVVLEGVTSGGKTDAMSGDRVYTGDFSALSQEGEYSIRISGYGESHPFRIASRPYRELKRGLLRSFYFQRCGTELREQHAGPWKHGACHLNQGRVYGTDLTLPSDGGWHDAGDYGKYVVAAAKAVADLLLAYEAYPGAFEDAMDIPETGSGIPDVLSEVRYELEWMFKMQTDDGGVFHKLTTYRFCGLDVMPEDDHLDLVFSPVSYAATGDYAASMALASRIYRPFDAQFADRCLSGARLAWEWLLANPNAKGFKNPPEISTGEYGDEALADELYWAAAELYRVTQEEEYLSVAEHLLDTGGLTLTELGWADVSGYGTLTLLMNGRNDLTAQVYDRLLGEWERRADELLAVAEQDGYRVGLAKNDYIWGSTMILMDHAMHLIFAAKLMNDAKYEETARQHFHYLMGANPLDISYVTGFGGNPVINPHHRPSVGDGVHDPVPGMVAGGPNQGLQDDAAQTLQGQPPARCFIDHVDSYSTNEMTIYWNSPAVFVAAWLDRS